MGKDRCITLSQYQGHLIADLSIRKIAKMCDRHYRDLSFKEVFEDLMYLEVTTNREHRKIDPNDIE